jgi:hypothetical protein
MIHLQEPALLSSDTKILGNPSDSFTNRRKVLGTIGLATTALCASSVPASAFIFGKKDELPIVKVKAAPGDSKPRAATGPSQAIGGFPEEWVRLQGDNLKHYANYLNSLKLKTISAQDVIAAHAKKRGNTWNSLPPREWWTRMGYTLRVVDRISLAMNTPVKQVVSAYRSPAYNALCSGAKKQSWHQANLALDLQFDTSPRNVTYAARTLRDRGLFKGGVGSYSSFTHVDTRGTNANW